MEKTMGMEIMNYYELVRKNLCMLLDEGVTFPTTKHNLRAAESAIRNAINIMDLLMSIFGEESSLDEDTRKKYFHILHNTRTSIMSNECDFNGRGYVDLAADFAYLAMWKLA